MINFKRFVLLSLALILFLLPIGHALSQVKELQGGLWGWITIGIFLLITAAYWIYMLIVIKKSNNKKDKEK